MNTHAPTRADLELEQLRLTNNRLAAETQKLIKDNEPDTWWAALGKKAVAIGGIVTIIGTLAGLYYSYDKTITDRSQARFADERIRFEKAITRLEAKSTLSKLVGLSALGGYAISSEPAVRRQTLFTLVSLIATDADVQAQTAVVDLVKGLPSSGRISADDWEYLQGLLVSQSRALMVKASLASRRQLVKSDPVSADEQTALILGDLIASNAKRRVAPKHADYAGIYCARCDFSGVDFPTGTNFSNAVLDNANFSDAKLENARFDDAELAGTRFVQADLSGAWLRSIDASMASGAGEDDEHVARGRTAYLDYLASSLASQAQLRLYMPDFSCADLTDAHFAGHALFPAPHTVWREYSPQQLAKNHDVAPLWYRSVPDFVSVGSADHPVHFTPLIDRPPKFYKATLLRADFRTVRFFGLIDVEDPEFFRNWYESKAGELKFAQGELDSRAFDSPDEMIAQDPTAPEAPPHSSREDIAHIKSFQRDLRGAFFGSDWSEASMSNPLSALLSHSPPTEVDFDGTFENVEGDPDLKCTPRHR